MKKSVYNEEYTRDDFQREVMIGDIINVCSTCETAWPEYYFEGYEQCPYQYGHGCTNCQGKVRMTSTKTGRSQSVCATNQRRAQSALISIKWNKNRIRLPEELFEI